MPWGAAIAAGASIASGVIGGNKAANAANNAQGRATKQLKFGRKMGQGYLDTGQNALEQALAMIRGSREQSLSEISRMGHSSRQGVLDRGQQQTSALSAQMASRGLGNTTVGANLGRGIAADTDRALADINEGLAGLNAGTIQNFAGMEAGALSDFARFMSGRADFFMGAQQQLAANNYGVQEQSSGYDFGGLGAGLGDILGYFSGQMKDGALAAKHGISL